MEEEREAVMVSTNEKERWRERLGNQNSGKRCPCGSGPVEPYSLRSTSAAIDVSYGGVSESGEGGVSSPG